MATRYAPRNDNRNSFGLNEILALYQMFSPEKTAQSDLQRAQARRLEAETPGLAELQQAEIRTALARAANLDTDTRASTLREPFIAPGLTAEIDNTKARSNVMNTDALAKKLQVFQSAPGVMDSLDPVIVARYLADIDPSAGKLLQPRIDEADARRQAVMNATDPRQQGRWSTGEGSVPETVNTVRSWIGKSNPISGVNNFIQDQILKLFPSKKETTNGN